MKTKIRIRMIVEYDMEWDHPPEYCTKEHIEFVLNEGTCCADNSLDDLRAIARRDGCLCDHTRYELIEVLDENAQRRRAAP